MVSDTSYIAVSWNTSINGYTVPLASFTFYCTLMMTMLMPMTLRVVSGRMSRPPD